MRQALVAALAMPVILASGVARASKCLPSTLEERLARADVVLSGRARSMDAELATTFDVDRVYKGKAPARVVLHTGGVKYAMLAPPWSYLVYAVMRTGSSGEPELFIETCGGSQRIDAAAEDLAELGEGTAAGAPGSALESGSAEARPVSPLQVDAGAPTVADADASDGEAPSEPAPDAPSSVAHPPTSGPPTATDAHQGRAPGAPPPDAGCAACSLGRPRGVDHELASFALLALGLFARRRRRRRAVGPGSRGSRSHAGLPASCPRA